MRRISSLAVLIWHLLSLCYVNGMDMAPPLRDFALFSPIHCLSRFNGGNEREDVETLSMSPILSRFSISQRVCCYLRFICTVNFLSLQSRGIWSPLDSISCVYHVMSHYFDILKHEWTSNYNSNWDRRVCTDSHRYHYQRKEAFRTENAEK